MEILKFMEVYYKSGQNDILNCVNLTVNKGDFLTITGPSGSGKTTLLRLSNNLISPTSGEIYYRGNNLSSYDPVSLRREVSLCFQTPQLFGDTVYDNLAFPFVIRKTEVDTGLITKNLTMFNIEEGFLRKDIRNLSGGERQRVALARSLMFKPDILLLDEITSALDEKNTLIVENAISDLNSQGITVLWITHNLLQGERLGNRRIFVEKGNVTEVGL